MKIGLVTTQFPTSSGYFDGGIAVFFSRAAELLVEAGHSVTVIVRQRSQYVPYSSDRFNIISVRKPVAKRSISGESPWAEVPHLHDLSVATYEACRSLYWAGRCEVFLATNNLAMSHDLVGDTSIPTVIRISSRTKVWSHENFSLDVRDAAIDQLELQCLSRAKFLIAPSERITKLLGEDGARVHVVRSPVPALLLEASHTERVEVGETIIVSSAREGSKGVHHAILAAKEYLSRYVNDSFLFAGGRQSLAPDGCPMSEYLEEHLSTFKERVIQLPLLRRDQFLKQLAAATIVLLPSQVDNLPNVLLEAMCLCKLVLITKNSSMDELIVDSQNGLVIESSEPAAILSTLVRARELVSSSRRGIEASAQATALEQCSPGLFIQRLMEQLKRATHTTC
ncbi:glycosyltransferase family 4 protein [Achromobacter arsenitoxydans]|uniref:Group 1 glycosyl transferase n=1 Tax=Achromobacter arsenitoxydans SY8 TaxID=477184 RepID=H0FB74_9BURK|nr:glycosyltransferase family 4 protein [Achromobacter arsenitoxydans]EHK64339.1 group 1 glycosyl transferase [Achromobacter arsenitoxydans SY8]